MADQEFEAAKASFPSEEVSGEDEKLGMGTADKEFDTIKSFTWTFGGTGSVKIKKVQDVTLNKTPKINLDIEEVTGVFRCDNLATGNVTINKANILYMHDTCKSKVKVDVCNCLIILKDGSATEYTVGKVGAQSKLCVDNFKCFAPFSGNSYFYRSWRHCPQQRLRGCAEVV